MAVVVNISKLERPFVALKEDSMKELSDNQLKMFIRKWATQNDVPVAQIRRVMIEDNSQWIIHTGLKKATLQVRVTPDGKVRHVY